MMVRPNTSGSVGTGRLTTAALPRQQRSLRAARLRNLLPHVLSGASKGLRYIQKKFPRVNLLRKPAVFARAPGPLTNGSCQLIHAWVTMHDIALEPDGLWTAR